MFAKFRALFFSNRVFNLIYTHHFFRNISSSIMYVFTGAYFLDLGMPLHFILLFYGLEFGIRGALCPLGLKIFHKIGVMKASFLSSVLMILFFVGISFSDENLYIGFASLILAAMSGAIYYPFLDVLEALYVQDDQNQNRTKQISMGLVSGSLGRVIGAAATGFLLTQFGFDIIVVFAGVMLMASIVPFYILPKPSQNLPKTRMRDVYKYMVNDDFKKLLAPFFGLQLIIIVRIVMIPIFIFTIVNELDSLGYLIALTILIETIFTLMAGHYSDKFGIEKIVRFSVLNYSLAIAAYVFLAKSALSIFFIESYYKIASNIFDSAARSGFHAHARQYHLDNIFVFGAAWQMALCFGELLTLPFYGLLAYFIGTNVFYVSFVAAILGVWMVHRYFKSNPPVK